MKTLLTILLFTNLLFGADNGHWNALNTSIFLVLSAISTAAGWYIYGEFLDDNSNNNKKGK